jgi:hypothetical protein
MQLDELRKIKQQQIENNKKLEGAKIIVVGEVKKLADEWELTYADVRKIFPAPKRKRKAIGEGPKMKYKLADGSKEWAGTGANPPKEFLPAIKGNKLHELCIDKTPEAIEAAKKYAANWNQKDAAKQKQKAK